MESAHYQISGRTLSFFLFVAPTGKSVNYTSFYYCVLWIANDDAKPNPRCDENFLIL